MTTHDQLRNENAVLRERFSRMSAAVLRINSSLDLDTVLHEAVDAARQLSGAGYGAIATTDDAGQPEHFITAGFSPQVHRQMVDWADGPRLFPHFRDLPGPLRLPDVRAYVESLGFSSDRIPVRSIQVTPMRHRGMFVGSFFLAEKASGQEFTGEDEQVLVLFAAQAATAIANARTHQNERRARADLEALVETSPIGVVVFDARTGNLLSLNREAKRIVEGLRTAGGSPEELLEVITCRRGDGREVSLAEFPLAQQLGSAERVRAEEMVLSVPDGRSFQTLINATPILSADGEVESVVVTMQDLAPLEELERQRAGFLGMVSHELRTPLTSIKGSTASVLGAPRSPPRAELMQFFRIIDEQADQMGSLLGDLLDQGRIEAGMLSVSVEPAEVASVVEQARGIFLSGGGRHALRMELPADLPRVMADQQRIVQVLSNLFSNAARHSPDSSPIRVAAERDGVHVAISVADEGRGVPPDQLPHLFRKHSQIGDRKAGIRGTGLGLAICKGLVEAHGGRISARSGGVDLGTRITFTLPQVEEARPIAVASPDRSRTQASLPEQTRILVVDDDPQTLRYVREALVAARFVPIVTGDPQELPDLVKKHKPSLVLLDLVLPGTDGMALLEDLSELADLPVIFISGYGREETVAQALESGASDYVVKPFSPTELVARIRAALRRHAEPEAFQLGALAIDFEARRVTVDGRRVELTAIEFNLLRALANKVGRVVTHETLLRHVWGLREAGEVRLLRTFVKNLRRKLGDDAANPTYIHAVRGVGYCMAKPIE